MLSISNFFGLAVVSLAATCLLTTNIPMSAQTAPLYSFNGDSAGDDFGTSVSGAGDVNNDGYADLIVGAPGDDNNGFSSGSARVLSGQDGSILYTFNGDSPGEEFGTSVSGAGDVNNDGYADLIVGAPSDDTNGFISGSARVLSGQDGSILYTFNGDSPGDELGSSVSGAGDVNNDGHADFIVGAPGDSSARVLSGQDGSILYTFNGDIPVDSFGQSVSGAGDVNNDGYADLIVGAAIGNVTTSGSARVLSGQDGSTLYKFTGDNASDLFGHSVSGAGDVNNDGFADLIVGAPIDDGNANVTGSAHVLSGQDGSTLYKFTGDNANDRLGWSVSGAGDVNNDGFADLIVGASQDENNVQNQSGSVRVFSGQDGSTLYTFNGDSANDLFGFSVSGAGDVNGDGLDDFIVGSEGGNYARVFVGETVRIAYVPLFTFEGDNSDDMFGSSVSGAGDVNNDGHSDLIVGARLDDINGSNSGSARVLSGQDGSTLYTFNGDDPLDQFGFSVSGAGDVNNDGFADLIVGAFLDNTNNLIDNGSARVLSGQNGNTLYTFNGDDSFDRLGQSVSGAGDVNNDGYADLIVGAPLDDNNADGTGSARVLSGQDGSTLYTFNGDSEFDQFGNSVSGAGDVNNDGYDDLIVGAPADDNNGVNSGSARVLSGQDGSILYTFDGEEGLGLSVSGAGDVNNDGFADLIVGTPEADSNGNSSGSASVFSGQDGSALYTFEGDDSFDRLGQSVSGVGDVNRDGFDDVIVGASGANIAHVLSGQDGSALYTFNGDNPGDGFGFSVSGAGDVNGDGVNDFIVGTDDGNYARVFVSQVSSILGDVNLDGAVSFLDIEPFIALLSGGFFQAEADIDGNGVVSFLDIAPFIAILSGQ